ncbi:Crp/Fnr family transcriptional regulator [Duganella qianjiadongensis]|uniref:Helix-turn-helix domain-containing protein n=1 Tax=Duganella qianjiadongensis TaxID=2692176 RepID=A0ABW9VHS0_9BURK|nr:Crp/Fnr family transcriptional regulator [Duganella qianjiadongensis]MYM38400.1 helix-turn-helix domain-containing protein [Duganella qianjiadongensis]
MSSLIPPQRNHLLAALPPAELARMLPHLQLLTLQRKQMLHRCGERIAYAYFPVTAVLSIDYILENGDTAEILNIGREGLLGISLCMATHHAVERASVHTTGYAYRIGAAQLLSEFYRNGQLMRLLLGYTQQRLNRISLSAICNRHHSLEQRLCRYLLEMLDRGTSRELECTQEALGAILGVRREGVTEAVRRLQLLGVLHWSRGRVRLLSRAGLEAHACECYQVLRKQTARPAIALLDLPAHLLPERRAGLLVSGRRVVAERRRSWQLLAEAS